MGRKITITGDLGSGKSTVAKKLAEMFGCRLISSGQVFRQLACEKGLSAEEMNKIAEIDPSIDDAVDGRLKMIGESDEFCVVDSRLGWLFIPDSYKVYLTVNPKIAAKRVFKSNRGSVEQYKSIEDAERGLIKRNELEQQRYLNKYNIDIYDKRNYDLVLDASCCDVDFAVKTIIDGFGERKT